MNLGVEKSVASRVVLIRGDEEVLRRQALSELLRLAGTDEFDTEFVQGDTSTPAEWIGSAGTVPFMGDRRTVVVRNLLRTRETAADWQPGLAGLPPTALIVLVADEEMTADDDRARKLGTVGQAWQSVVTKAGGSVIDCSLKDAGKLQSALREAAKEAGKQLTPPAATALAEMCGGSYSRCISELEKLCIYVEPSLEVRETDVLAAATPSREWNVFKLADAVVAGQPGQALRQLRVMVSSATKADEAANRSILPNLARQFKLIWQARACIDAGINPGAPSESIIAHFPKKPNLGTENPWARNRAIQSAKNVSKAQAEQCLNHLSEADARLKGVLPSVDALETLESLILACCDTMGRRA